MTFGRNYTEFKEKRAEEREKNLRTLLLPPRGLNRGTYAANDPKPPAPKHEYIRSEALMRAYRLIPCQNCGADDGTVCGAHSNWAEHGKGRSIKADDNRCASLCHTCHGMLDQGSILGRAERMALWWNAHIKTVGELQARSLWPERIPIPDLTWSRA
jgi:hypothetical protein